LITLLKRAQRRKTTDSGFAFDELCPAAVQPTTVQPQPSAPDSTLK